MSYLKWPTINFLLYNDETNFHQPTFPPTTVLHVFIVRQIALTVKYSVRRTSSRSKVRGHRLSISVPDIRVCHGMTKCVAKLILFARQ